MNNPNNINALSVFSYEGNNVTFRDVEGTLMVNATEMAKAFGKKPAEWLRLASSKEYIEAYESSDVHNSHITQSVMTSRGNSQVSEQGTWMHEDVALEFFLPYADRSGQGKFSYVNI